MAADFSDEYVQHNLLTTKTLGSWTVASSDKDLTTLVTGYPGARALYINGAGTIYVKRASDSGFTPYTFTAPGYLFGTFIAVGGTTTGTSSGMVINAEW